MSPSLKIKAPLAWFGPGRLVRHAAVIAEGGILTFAGPSAGSPLADERLEVDGFLMPAVADRLHMIAPRYHEGLGARNQRGQSLRASGHLVLPADRHKHGHGYSRKLLGSQGLP